MTRRSWLNAAAAILLVAVGAVQGEAQLDNNTAHGQPAGKATLAAKPIAAVDRSYMDRSVSPCKDFYAYANGACEKVPIPGEYPAYGVNQEIDNRNFAILKEILEDSARVGGPKGSVVQRVGDFYASGMDEAAIDRAGLRPLAPWLKCISAIASRKDLGCGHRRVARPGPQCRLPSRRADRRQGDDEDDRGRESRRPRPAGARLLFRAGKNAEDIRAAYVAHIARMFELAGDAPAPARAATDSIMAFETKLAKASRTLVDLRDPEKNYNKFDRAALGKLAPGFDWNGYFDMIAFPGDETKLLVRQPEFATALAGLLASEPLAVWRNYLRWHLLSETANYLSKPFVAEHFSFYGKKLSGATEMRPRWKRVLAAEDAAIGEDLGQLYVQKAFSPAAKARADDVELYQGSHARAHLRRQLDERGDEGRGVQETRRDAEQSGLSRHVARLRQAGPRAAALCRQRAGRGDV